MASTVPEQRIVANQSDILITEGVRSVHWIDSGRVINWASGRGDMLIPGTPLGPIASGVTRTFPVTLQPRYQTLRAAFSYVVTSATGTASCTIVLGATTVTIAAPTRENAAPVTIMLDQSSQNTVRQLLSFTATANLGAIEIECFSVESVPRGVLASGAASLDLGVDLSLVMPRQPIFEGSLSNQLLARLPGLRDACRRNGGVTLPMPTEAPFVVSGASWVGLHDDDISLLGRYIYSSGTTDTLSVMAYVRCTDGTTAGELRLSNVSGGTGVSTIAIPTGTTAWTWIGTATNTPDTFSCDAEDPTAADGRRSSRWDDHYFEARRTAGAGNIEIATISIWEAA